MTLTTTTSTKTYEKATTPDGRWTYGYGEYKKKLADYLGLKPPSQLTCKDIVKYGPGGTDSLIYTFQTIADKVTCTASNLTQKVKASVKAKVPTVLQGLLAVTTGDKTYINYADAAKITFPVYYIFAKPNNSSSALTGKYDTTRFISYPLLRVGRDTAFASFAKSFRANQNDLSRDTLIKTYQTKTPLATSLPITTTEADASGGSSWWPIIAVGAGAFILWRFLNRR